MQRTHPTKSRKALIPALALLWLALAALSPNTTRAEIFKCVAADGALTFSQSPCHDEGSKVTVQKTPGGAANESADCEQLPVSSTNRIGACDDNEEPSDDVELALASAVQLPDEQREPQSNAALQAQERQARVREEEQRSQCKQNINAQIDGINAQMRSGYSSSLGESLKKKRRALEDRLRDC